MPMLLQGSCRCGAVRFSVESQTPVPYMHCYCSICRKTGGGGGYGINLGGIADTLKVEGREAVGTYSAEISRDGRAETSPGERNFCTHCGTALWVFDPRWPEHVHPFASAIDTPLPAAPSRVHIMLDDKPGWVPLPEGPGEEHFRQYPDLSLEDWHKKHGVWVE